MKELQYHIYSRLTMQDKAPYTQKTATFIGLLAPVFFWPIYPSLTAFIDNLPAFQLLTIGFFFSFGLSLIIWKIKKLSFLAVLKQPLHYWVIGIFGIFGFNSCYLLSLQHAPPANAFLITATWPLLAILLNTIVFKERLHLHHIIACILSLIGILCIALNDGIERASSNHTFGYVLALSAAFIWATYSLLIKRHPFPKAEFIGGICGACAVSSLLFHYLLENTVSVIPTQLFPIALIGIGPLGLAYYCWNYGAQYGDIRTLSILSFLGHFLTISLLVLVGKAHFTPMLITACSLIISSALIGSSGLLKKLKAN